MVFLTQYWVCLVVILRACLFADLAISAIILIQSCGSVFGCGGGGIVVWLWFLSSSITGWVYHAGMVFVMYIAFLIRWYVARCFFHCFCNFSW